MELILGSAQFGFAYGVTNSGGQVSREEVTRILALARDNGITRLDTAMVYGASEEVLGDIATSQGFRVVSKLPRIPEAAPADLAAWVAQNVAGSLARLRRSRLEVLMLHRPADLEGALGAALWRALEAVRRAGLVERLGISVYRPEEMVELASRFDVEVVQLPLNAFDQRFVDAAIPWARRRGIEIHARSLFLQGSLLVEPDALPARLAVHRPIFARYRDWCAAQGLAPLQAAFAFARGIEGVDAWVVGVTGTSELAEILAARDQVFHCDADFSAWASADNDLILPSNWKK